VEGQERLRSARVLIVGAGGLGAPASLYLAAMGVGTIGIIDDDRVAPSNLPRQILFRDKDISRPKAEVAKERLSEVSPNTAIVTFNERLTPPNALERLRGFDLVLDGTDNFSTRYLINDACLVLGVPLLSASILKFEGQLAVLCTKSGPCYRCLFPEMPEPGTVPSCAEAGVIGALAGVMGTMMAMEAVKIVTKVGVPLSGMLIYDALSGNFRRMALERDPQCAGCAVPFGERKLRESYDAAPCGANELEISWQEWQRRSLPLVDVREAWEFSERPSPGVLIPLGSLFERMQELPREPFGVVCASGSRSLTAAALLKSKGFAAVSIRGGIRSKP